MRYMHVCNQRKKHHVVVFFLTTNISGNIHSKTDTALYTELMSPQGSATTICLLVTSVLLGAIKSSHLEELDGDFVVERYDAGDVVHWLGITDCNDNNGYAPSSGNCSGAVVMWKSACCCDFLNSFTTLAGKCERLYDERSGGNYSYICMQ